MGAQLRGVEVYFSYHGERFHSHFPATLSPIIGKHGVLQCRLDSVRRPGAAAAVAAPIPSTPAYLHRGWIRRRIVPAPIYPNDTVVFEHGDAASSRFAAPSYARGAYDHAYAAEQAAAPAFGDGTRPPLSPWQLAHSIERELAKPMAAALSPPPAPVATKGPADDETADRKRWLEILDLYHAAKEGRIAVDNTRGIGIVPPEQPFRRARSG